MKMSIELNQLDLDLDFVRCDVEALKNELQELRRETAIATKSVRLLLGKLGYSKSVSENLVDIARRKVAEDVKIS